MGNINRSTIFRSLVVILAAMSIALGICQQPASATGEVSAPQAAPVQQVNTQPGQTGAAAPAGATTEAAVPAAAPAQPAATPAAAEAPNDVPAEIAGLVYSGTEEEVKKLCDALAADKGVESKGLTPAEVRILVVDAIGQITAEKKACAEIFTRAKALCDERYDMSKRFFNYNRLNILVAGVLLLSFIGYYTYHARQGREMFIRKIAGLSAIDEAVGRATEMGKPVLYIPGIYDMDDIQTIAGVSILGHVAKKTAEYETNLLVPCTRAMVMSTAQEVVREAYLKVGRVDSFKPENIRYLTDDQFGYVAGVDGIMMRERPAANFYLGVFFAESLILAETGHHVGAIQIAGTAMVHQIPFFVAACDYTLIGEELFAASAYLSREPMQLGTLKGQDVGKFLIIIVIILGVAAETFGFHAFTNWFTIR